MNAGAAQRRRLRRLASHVVAPRPCSAATTTTATAAAATKMLGGLRVVELATVIAAPACAALLADNGADVIKIENPRKPDFARGWGLKDDPAKTADPGLRAAPGGGGSAFVNLNRGKRSVALDPTTPRGRALLFQLLETADIFVTNVRLRSLRRLGLDYESLHPQLPRLIYGQLSAWGRAGPMVDDPGYDFSSFWAHSGVQDILRSSDTAPMPRFPGGVGDYTTGAQLYGGILGALYHRERTGKGQLVDAALLRAGVWFLSHAISMHAGGAEWTKNPSGLATGGVRETTELGDRRTAITNACFKCRDGAWIQLMGLERDRHMPATLKALGLTLEGCGLGGWKGGANKDWARATRVVDAVMAGKTREEWGAVFDDHGVWWKGINRFEDMMGDVQANAAGCFVTVPGVSHKLIGSPVLLSAADSAPVASAPGFGAHTVEVLKELGCSESDVGQLVEQGVVRCN
jgi:crotonobetainyl-CoA:carnitine CoA-transferase CaiB-like acyl-CoA transferase